MAKNRKEMDGSKNSGAKVAESAKTSKLAKPSSQVVMDVWNADEKYSLRLGVVFRNKDGSLNILLNALPVNRKLRLVERKNGQPA